MADTGKTIGLIKALASVDPSEIQSSVEGWLDDHPEATTTVQDGSITKQKLDQNLQQTVDDVGDLKSAVTDIDDALFDVGKNVYDPDTENKDRVQKMIRDNRIRYYAPADYREGSELDELIRMIFDKTVVNEKLEEKYYQKVSESCSDRGE